MNENHTTEERVLAYAEHVHKRCQEIIRFGLITFFALPVLLLLMRTLADVDKVIVLLIWIICMFVLAALMILISYLDKRLYHTVSLLRPEQAEPEHEDLRILQPVGPLGKQLMEFDVTSEEVQEALNEK